jgi:hypothetical protein
MEEETYYVNVREPAETRKKILESSRQVVIALQRYENFKLKKMKKQDLADKLRRNFREINELILRLKKEMPQVRALRKTTEKAEKPAAQIKIQKGKSDLKDLERELNEIEMKLKNLR